MSKFFINFVYLVTEVKNQENIDNNGDLHI